MFTPATLPTKNIRQHGRTFYEPSPFDQVLSSVAGFPNQLVTFYPDQCIKIDF